jgi:hypothetical protein
LYEADENGLPSGSVLQSGSIERAEIGWTIQTETIFFDSFKTLNAGENYVLKITCETCVGTYYETRNASINDPYPDGRFYINNGETWNEWVDGDLFFKLYFTLPTIPIAYNAQNDVFASVGLLFSDLWGVIALMAGVPLAFYVITKIRDMIIDNAKN